MKYRRAAIRAFAVTWITTSSIMWWQLSKRYTEMLNGEAGRLSVITGFVVAVGVTAMVVYRLKTEQ